MSGYLNEYLNVYSRDLTPDSEEISPAVWGIQKNMGKNTNTNINSNNARKKSVPPSALAKIYYDPSHASGYTGNPKLLARAAGATLKETVAWLKTQDPYTKFKGARRRFKHDRIFVQGLDEQWSVDLISVIPLEKFNNGHKYILTAVDTLSKYARAAPIKNKTGVAVAGALKKFFKDKTPRKIRTDLGKEFYNSHVQTLFKKKGIKHFGAYNYTKAAIVERFHRTLRAKLWRYFQATNTWRYVETLPKLIEGYNATTHSATGMAPKNVNENNQFLAWRALYGDMLDERRSWSASREPGQRAPRGDIAAGQLVRLSKAKHAFEKGYTVSWTDELFRIRRVIPPTRGVKNSRHRYIVEDMNGEIVLGSFQREELQPVEKAAKTVRKITRRNKEGKFVEWRGYPNTLQTFVPNRGRTGDGNAAVRDIPNTK